ncbi:MAG: nucleotidyltransferase family protein [Acidobacteriota bacterium]
MSEDKKRSLLMVAALRGIWRDEPLPLEISDAEFREVIPLLLGSGFAALGWRRIRNTPLATSPDAADLLDGYRLYSLHNAVIENQIAEVFASFRAHSIEPILIKGWAVARLYAEKGLRLYGDIDLVVRPSDYEAASGLLNDRKYAVDLHSGLSKLDAHTMDELYARSQIVKLKSEDVRVLGAEDHLRVLCEHFLRDGGWQARALCDISLAVENRPAGFDWDICLGKDERRAEWVACAIGLANRLLDAKIDDTPVASDRLPRWLVPAVLKQWRRPNVSDHYPQELMIKSLVNPLRAAKALLGRWPDPVRATVMMEGRFNNLPRLPFQAGLYMWRMADFLKRLPHSFERAR